MNLFKKFFAILSFIFIIIPQTHADGGGGVSTNGGGAGVEIDGKVYLLDLVLTGKHLSPYFNKTFMQVGLNIYASDTQRKLGSFFQSDEIFLISNKLAEIEYVDPVFASAMIQAVVQSTWVLTDMPLNSAGNLNEDLPFKVEVLPLAFRQNTTVYIQRNLWKKMDAANRVALIIHEILCALGDKSASIQYHREMVSKIFTEEFIFSDANKNLTTDISYYPSETSLKKTALAAGWETYQLPKQFRYYTHQIEGVDARMYSSAIFFPRMKLTFINAPADLKDPAYLDLTEKFSSPYLMPNNICYLESQYRISKMEFQFLKVVLKPALDNGITRPRFDWSAETVNISVHDFSRDPSPYVANCDHKERNRLTLVAYNMDKFIWHKGYIYGMAIHPKKGDPVVP